jgi:hypothetical protein
MVATFSLIVSAKGPSTDPSWLRAINLVIAAVVIVIGSIATLTLILTGGRVPDAALSALFLWLFVHTPLYSFLPRDTNWQVVVVGTTVQWIFIAVIIARVTRGVRTSRALALSVGTILAVAAAMIAALLLLGFRPWFEGP